MLRKSAEIGTMVFHELYGIGIFKGWWLKNSEYARVEYLICNNPGNLLIPRGNLTEVEDPAHEGITDAVASQWG